MLVEFGCMGQSSTNSAQIQLKSLSDEETSVNRGPFPPKPVQATLETTENSGSPVLVQKPHVGSLPIHTTHDLPCIVSVRSLSDGSTSSYTSSCHSFAGYDAEVLSQSLCCPYFDRNVTYTGVLGKADSQFQSTKALTVNTCHKYLFNLALLAEAAISQSLGKFGINQSASTKDTSSAINGKQSDSNRSEMSSINNELIRSKNNEACRKSRIKRKKGREENEAKLKILRDSNHDLKLKIQQLEAEVKEARDRLVDEMKASKQCEIN